MTGKEGIPLLELVCLNWDIGLYSVTKSVSLKFGTFPEEYPTTDKKRILILALFIGLMRESKIRLQIREKIKRVCFLFFIVLERCSGILVFKS